MMRVIFYHVGKGDMSLVLLPNGEALIVDCYKVADVIEEETVLEDIADRIEEHILNHRERMASHIEKLAESVPKERAKEKKIPIAILAITHADSDHITARKILKERFEIGLLIDNGREYRGASEATKDYIKFRNEMKDSKKYQEYTRSQYNIRPETGAIIDVLCPNRDIEVDEDSNNQCLVIKCTYKEKSILFTGDSTLYDWTDDKTGIINAHGDRVASDILHVSHHGSRTFFTPPGQRKEGQPEYSKEEYDTTALNKINPIISFITCSDDENSDHPHPIALELYQELTNQNINENNRSSHVILSRNSQHLHQVIDGDGNLYMRTSRLFT